MAVCDRAAPGISPARGTEKITDGRGMSTGSWVASLRPRIGASEVLGRSIRTSPSHARGREVRRERRLECFGQASLFEYSVSGVARLDVSVNWKVLFGYRAVPNFVVALSCSNPIASRIPENALQMFGKARHKAGMLAGGRYVQPPMRNDLVRRLRRLRLK